MWCIQKKFHFAEKWDLIGVIWLTSAKTFFFFFFSAGHQLQKLKNFKIAKMTQNNVIAFDPILGEDLFCMSRESFRLKNNIFQNFKNLFIILWCLNFDSTPQNRFYYLQIPSPIFFRFLKNVYGLLPAFIFFWKGAYAKSVIFLTGK